MMPAPALFPLMPLTVLPSPSSPMPRSSSLRLPLSPILLSGQEGLRIGLVRLGLCAFGIGIGVVGIGLCDLLWLVLLQIVLCHLPRLVTAP